MYLVYRVHRIVIKTSYNNNVKQLLLDKYKKFSECEKFRFERKFSEKKMSCI